MTAVTVIDRKEIKGVPGMEVISGTFTDGYTYSTKFSKIVAAVGQSRSRSGFYATISGSVVTLVCSSASGDTFDLIVMGFL